MLVNSPCAPAQGSNVMSSMPVISVRYSFASASACAQPGASCVGCASVKPGSAAMASFTFGLYFIVQLPSG